LVWKFTVIASDSSTQIYCLDGRGWWIFFVNLRCCFSLTTTVVAAYSDTPRWAIPITWSGNLPSLPVIPQHKYTAWMGVDGGFSSSIYAAALAYHVKNKIDIGT
jgi:hypothetical protein